MSDSNPEATILLDIMNKYHLIRCVMLIGYNLDKKYLGKNST